MASLDTRMQIVTGISDEDFLRGPETYSGQWFDWDLLPPPTPREDNKPTNPGLHNACWETYP
ncbi:hypothetical protein FJZ17_02045 [Candidatus Pacearchaeota archaeon]|nr:hypothetical protein [Candidatus Pacearchaeota archaeon]